MTTDGTNAIIKIPFTTYLRAARVDTYWHALWHAKGAGFRIRAHNDYTGAGDREVSIEAALDLVAEDPSLVYVTNWTGP